MKQIKLGTIKAECVLASENVHTGNEVYTWLLTYPRFIHSEVLTHGLLGINSASSRAVPLKKMRERITGELFIPDWTINQKGMTSRNFLRGWKAQLATMSCRALYRAATVFHTLLEKLNVHKQHANRFLEPWMMIQTVVTATEVNNLYKLRDSDAAQPEFQTLVRAMMESASKAEKQKLHPGEWHIPLITKEQKESLDLFTQLKASTAQTARASYYLPGTGEVANVETNLALCKRLLDGKHMSPFQHCAMAIPYNQMSGNLVGFIPLRKGLRGESNGDVNTIYILTPQESVQYMSQHLEGFEV